jgi:hypothetical protein
MDVLPSAPGGVPPPDRRGAVDNSIFMVYAVSMEEIFRFAFGMLVDVVFLGTGKLLLPLISFGRWRVNMNKSGAGWFSGIPLFRRDVDGHTYCSYTFSVGVGTLFWMCVVILFFAKA